MPRGWVWDRLVLNAAVAATAQPEGGSGHVTKDVIGSYGVAVTELRPSGEVEIAGKRYEAAVEIGDIAAGASVVVRRRGDFGLIVEKAET